MNNIEKKEKGGKIEKKEKYKSQRWKKKKKTSKTIFQKTKHTNAFLLAIFLVPNAKQVVITAGNPSGIAATANATAILKHSKHSRHIK